MGQDNAAVKNILWLVFSFLSPQPEAPMSLDKNVCGKDSSPHMLQKNPPVISAKTKTPMKKGHLTF